jgi:uncharacterized protein (TIGR03435 family)
MLATMASAALMLLTCSLAYGQTGDTRLSFDAASVKPADPILSDGLIVVGMAEPTGGPGTNDPSRIRYPVINLKMLLINAYDLRESQIVGPDWLDTEYFQIEATMPPDTTREQFRAMLQDLLVEKFKAKIHRETKEVRGYALVVGKSGPKMKKFVGVPGADYSGRTTLSRSGLDGDGFNKQPLIPPGRAKLYTTIGTYGVRLTGQEQSMDALAARLAYYLKRPVVDSTGLTAKYNFTLTFLPEGMAVLPSADPLPNIYSALQSQLGLNLEPKQSTETTIIIDHIEKKLTQN